MTGEYGCTRFEGHEWQRLSQPPDPSPFNRVVHLANAICIHCEAVGILEAEDEDE